MMSRKVKIFAGLQIVLLASAVILGSILNDKLGNDGLRTMHRSIGLLAGIVGIVAVVLSRKISGVFAKVTGILSVVATFIAGYAGSSLKNADDYQQMFNLMRSMGIMALTLAFVSLLLVVRYSRKVSRLTNTSPNSQ